MVALPDRPERAMADMIYRAIQRKTVKDAWLGRLSASSIGEECLRKLYMKFRGYNVGPQTVSVTEGRVQKIFDTGHLKELQAVNDLRAAGFLVWDKDEDGKQFRYIDETGHFICKVDGVIKGVLGAPVTPHLLEIKSHNKKNFDRLLKEPIKESFPKHYAQIQSGMKAMEMDRGLYVAICKDDERYHFERVRRDETELSKHDERVRTLVHDRLIPAGISATASAKGCRYCDFKESGQCVGRTPPARNCRTCVQSSPGPNGTWTCGLDGHELDQKAQRAACQSYEGKNNLDSRLYLLSG